MSVPAPLSVEGPAGGGGGGGRAGDESCGENKDMAMPWLAFSPV